MTKIMLAQSIKVCHNEHGRVLTGRVSIHSHLLTIDFQILMPDSVKSLKKSNGELKIRGSSSKLEQRVSEQECSVKIVSDSSASSSILNQEAEASLKFIGHEYDVTKVQ